MVIINMEYWFVTSNNTSAKQLRLDNLNINKLLIIIMMLMSILVSGVGFTKIPESNRSNKAIAKVSPRLKAELSTAALELGAKVYFRIFKQESIIEAWIQKSNTEDYKLFKTYPICTFSGKLGPKQKEGDMQSPEGFYFVKPNQMNPYSQYHLSFNLGYPNAYERHYQRTGSALMVHGSCVSIGCYAMTDPVIEEIYTLADSALKNGQSFFRVHAFPFKLEDSKLEKYKNSQWYNFWLNLKQGYDYFETNKRPPNVTHKRGRYYFDDRE